MSFSLCFYWLEFSFKSQKHWQVSLFLAVLHANISSSNFQVAEKDQTRCCQRYRDSFCLNKTFQVAGFNVLNDLPSKTMTATGYPRTRWSSYIQRQLSFISYCRWISEEIIFFKCSDISADKKPALLGGKDCNFIRATSIPSYYCRGNWFCWSILSFFK